MSTTRPAPQSDHRPPRTIEVDGRRLTFHQYVSELEPSCGPKAIEVAAAAFGIGDLIVIGEDRRARYELSGYLVD